MSSTAGLSLRRLVEDARPIVTAGKAPSAKKSHPLGAGINARKDYSGGGGRSRILLPEKGEGFERLKLMLVESVPGLPSELWVPAWHLLLNSPGQVVEVKVPSSGELLEEGITPSEVDGATLRRLVLGSVMYTPDESMADGLLTGNRVAAIAALTVQANRRFVLDAWLRTQWLSTTRALAAAMEQVVDLSSHNYGSGEQITLLVSQSRVGLVDENLAREIRHAAAVCGFGLSILEHTPDKHGANIRALRSQRPSWLAILGQDPSIDSARDDFLRTASTDRVIQMDPISAGEIRESLRERFFEMGGVSASLHLRPIATEHVEPPAQGRATMPISPVECLHTGGGHVYVLDGDSGLWWTRDTANHADAVFKQYRKEAAMLIHVADLDGEGRVMDGKHKGIVGREVSVAGMHSCSRPHHHAS